jgi:hypothetical protein
MLAAHRRTVSGDGPAKSARDRLRGPNLIPKCRCSNPAAPASQSGLCALSCECRLKRRGTAAFRGSALVSACGIWLRNAHFGSLSPRAGVSTTGRAGNAPHGEHNGTRLVALKLHVARNGDEILLVKIGDPHELLRAVARPEAARPRCCTRARHCRRRARLLEGARRGVGQDPRAWLF